MLAVSVEPDGITAECVDAHGDTLMRAEAALGRPAEPRQVAAAFRTTAERAACGGPVIRAAVVSAAGPVDRMTGRLVRLPDEPFRLGELDPAAVLRPLVSGQVIVDNDVNWAARAERDAAGRGHDADFAYLFLGEGLGAAVVSNGDVVRGHAPGRRGRPHNRPRPRCGAVHRRVRRSRAAAAGDERDRRPPPAGDGRQSGQRRRRARDHRPRRQRGSRRPDRARRPRVRCRRRLLGDPAHHPRRHHRASRPPAPAGPHPARRSDQRAVAGRRRADALSHLRSAILDDARERTRTMAAAARDAR